LTLGLSIRLKSGDEKRFGIKNPRQVFCPLIFIDKAGVRKFALWMNRDGYVLQHAFVEKHAISWYEPRVFLHQTAFDEIDHLKFFIPKPGDPMVW